MSETKHIAIDFLYVDIESCTRCKGTESNLTTALQMAQSLLDAAEASVIIRKTLVDSEQAAMQLGLVSSPTIRVNGRDIDVDLRESHCEDCNEICGCGEDITCRVWRYKGQDYDVAPVPVLLNAIMSAVYAPTWVEDAARPRTLSDNLRRFFAGKRESTKVCCDPEKAAACCAPEDKPSCCGVESQLQPATCGC